MMTGAIDKAIENLVCPDEINLLKKFRENYKPLVQNLFDRKAAGRFSIFSHGDCWNNNFCFLSDENVSHLRERWLNLKSPADGGGTQVGLSG